MTCFFPNYVYPQKTSLTTMQLPPAPSLDNPVLCQGSLYETSRSGTNATDQGFPEVVHDLSGLTVSKHGLWWQDWCYMVPSNKPMYLILHTYSHIVVCIICYVIKWNLISACELFVKGLNTLLGFGESLSDNTVRGGSVSAGDHHQPWATCFHFLPAPMAWNKDAEACEVWYVCWGLMKSPEVGKMLCSFIFLEQRQINPAHPPEKQPAKSGASE